MAAKIGLTIPILTEGGSGGAILANFSTKIGLARLKLGGQIMA